MSYDPATNLFSTGGAPLGAADLNTAIRNLSGGGVIATGTTKSRSLAARAAEIANVLDFGADPTGATDSRAAIQAAIASISASQGGVVWFPTGLYKILAPLIIPNSDYYITLQGSGWGAQIFAGGAASFDMITSSGGVAGFNFAQIKNLRLSGSGLTGTSNIINTLGMGTWRIDNVFFQGLAVGGSGVYANGYGGVYNHEVFIENCQLDSYTGVIGFNLGAASSDSSILNCIIQGRGALANCIYFNAGAAHWKVNDGHFYNSTGSVLAINSPSDSLWFTNAQFDGAGLTTADTITLTNANNCVFSECEITFNTPGYSNVKLVNSSNNTFIGCTFEGSGGVYAVNETGTSNNNIFNSSQLLGTFTASPPLALVGAQSAFRVQGVDTFLRGNVLSPAPGSTTYIGTGAASGAELNVITQVPYDGWARINFATTTTAPGAGQSYTITVRKNSANTSLVATISGANFSAKSLGIIPVVAGDSLTASVVTSGGAAVPTSISVTLVVNH